MVDPTLSVPSTLARRALGSQRVATNYSIQYLVPTSGSAGTNTAGPKPISMKPAVRTLRGYCVNASDG
nr:MAG TPA: hypothetical protein [Caudoviricetes sp.]